MAESKHISDENVKASDIFERAKEEIQAVIHTDKLHVHHHKETHGTGNDIDENTPIESVKAPNVFERAKEEIEALIQAIHDNRDSENREKRDQSVKSEGEDGVKSSPKFLERAKEEMEAIIHHQKSPHHHYKETHGRNDDIDENTPIDEVRGPSIFERAKEEIEALVEAIHYNKESNNVVASPSEKEEERGFAASVGRGLEKVCSPDKESGFGASVGKGLEKVCSPWGNKRD